MTFLRKTLLLAVLMAVSTQMPCAVLTISLSQAGTLGERIADSEKLLITDLTLSGELNGSDMLFLREMAGRSFTGTKTHGQLARLDLTATKIVSGGTSYMRYYAGDSPVEPRTVEDEFPQWLFSGCDSLVEVVLPAGVTTIGEYAFRGCNLLERVVVPEGVTTIGNGAFYGCFHLTDISVPAGLKQLGSYAFRQCASLVSVQLPAALQRIGTETFYGCTSLTAAALPQATQTVGDRAFYGCRSLTDVQLPMFLLQIGASAFYGCNALTEVTLPATTTTVGDAAFSSCTSLTSIGVAAANKNYRSIDGVLFNAAADHLVCYPAGRTATSYEVPQDVVQIGPSAFAGTAHLQQVGLPATLRTIGNTAFMGSGLTSVSVPEGVETAGVGAFMFCPALESGHLPSTLTEIDPELFAGSATTAITVSPEHPSYTSQGGVVFSKDMTSLVIYPSGRPGPYIVPDGVSRIGAYAFEYAELLDAIYLPASLNSIGEQAFYLSYIETIYCRAVTPPFVYDYGLDEIQSVNMQLYVPENTMFDYMDAEGWSNWYIFNYEELSDDEMEQAWQQAAETAGITLPRVQTRAEGQPFDLLGRRTHGIGGKGIVVVDGKKLLRR